MKRQPLLNVSHLAVEQRRLLQLFGRREEEEEAYFVDYIPPARDAINLPPSVIYVLAGLLLVIIATYAIVGHLIKDLMHDLAGNAPTPRLPPPRVSGDLSHHSVQPGGPVSGIIFLLKSSAASLLFPSFFVVLLTFWVSVFLRHLPSNDPPVSLLVSPSQQG